MKEPPSPHDPGGIAIAALRVACPSFETAWADHVSDWADDPAARGGYIDTAAFAGHLVSLLERGQTTESQTVFDAVERLYDTGDAGIRYLLTVGLLEAVQNIAANRRGWDFEARFRSWLGPTSIAEWDELHAFWGTSDGWAVSSEQRNIHDEESGQD